MTTKHLAGLIFLLFVATTACAQGEITVYKSPACGCCKKWISHLEENGFKVKPVDRHTLTPRKINYGIGNSTVSSHTAVIDDYVIGPCAHQ